MSECGFPSVYRVAIPALDAGRKLAPHDEEAARIQACMALIGRVLPRSFGASDSRQRRILIGRRAKRLAKAGRRGTGRPATN